MNISAAPLDDTTGSITDPVAHVEALGASARNAAVTMATASTADKNAALNAIAWS